MRIALTALMTLLTAAPAALADQFHREDLRIPMAAGNDKFFGPQLAHRMHAAFTAAGGRARFIDAPAFRRDGHLLFFAVSPKGSYAYRSGLRTPAQAGAAALAECAEHAPDCALYATGDELAGQGNSVK